MLDLAIEWDSMAGLAQRWLDHALNTDFERTQADPNAKNVKYLISFMQASEKAVDLRVEALRKKLDANCGG